jgi:hypothetical protein
MKTPFIFTFLLLVLNNSFGQSGDTLNVLVLSPNQIEVAVNFIDEYNTLKNEIVDKRLKFKEQKTKDRQQNIQEYNKQPDYTKQMFENELAFYDSLTIDNYISLVVREYIAHRLFKPFKIKPRIVLVTSIKSTSNIEEYSKLASQKQNFFIINFPTMKLYKESGDLKVVTRTELYSSKTNQILLSEEHLGLPKGGLTDYPMCSGDNWDCAFVNSVFPSLFEVVKIIADTFVREK